MRIQHNIMAMSAYRNYTNNVAAMKKNLERLSSGYKINRAGDDAAGLAISEKMRAQITGLETAQKNAKDGISLVQTAEGALTEVHDMLNRMVELATMSANGTYDNDTDRAQLQKEMDQLLEEINRIADGANFNGIQLLDGSMDTEVHNTLSAVQQMTVKNGIIPDTSTNNAAEAGEATILHTDANASVTVGFSIDLHDLAFLNQDGQNLTITIGDAEITLQGSTASTGVLGDVLSGEKLLDAITAAIGDNITINGQKFTVEKNTTNGNTRLDFKLVGSGSFTGADVKVSGSEGSLIVADSEFIDDAETWKATTAAAVTNADIKLTCSVAVPGWLGGTDSNYGDVLKDATLKVEIGDTVLNFTITNDASAAGTTAGGGAILVTNEMDGAAAWAAINAAIKEAAGKWNSKQESTDGVTSYDKIDTSVLETLTATPLTANTAATLAEKAKTQETTLQSAGLTGKAKVDYNVATTDIVNSTVATEKRLASTYFKLDEILDANSLKNGGSVTIGKTEYVFTTEDKEGSGNTKYVNISDAIDADGNVDWSRVAQLLTHAAADNTTYTVGHKGDENGTIYVEEIDGQTNFAKNGVSTLTTKEAIEASLSFRTVTSTEPSADAKALTLQIGDTADPYNQLVVNIQDMHAESLGLNTISIADQESAAKAIDSIKAAINTVSDVRGTLGATQNRLDHTINNLSVMTENIQDAESTIRDTDIAEEMMAYTKNNILIQSAQAMLAQANQVPQGVLQLLQ